MKAKNLSKRLQEIREHKESPEAAIMHFNSKPFRERALCMAKRSFYFGEFKVPLMPILDYGLSQAVLISYLPPKCTWTIK